MVGIADITHVFTFLRHLFYASNCRQAPSFVGANKKEKRVLSLHRLLKPNAAEGEQAEMKRQVQRKPFGAEMRKVCAPIYISSIQYDIAHIVYYCIMYIVTGAYKKVPRRMASLRASGFL